MDKKSIAADLMRYNARAGVITKSQIARYLGTKKAGTRVNRLVEDLTPFDGKYYFVQDVAEELLRRSM